MQQQKTYTHWLQMKEKDRQQLAILIDPDKASDAHLLALCQKANEGKIDCFFVGGSLLSSGCVENVVSFLKANTSIPILLFPGSTMQLTNNADAVLFLSLISGRNADLLIGKHVETAPFIHKNNLETISTGYMLIDSGRPTSVSYMSGTQPIPYEKDEIAVCTAMAGEMLGLKAIYLEGGSGAENPVSIAMISAVKKNINIPLIVGGGIRDANTASQMYNAGANILVVGTKVEQGLSIIDDITAIKK